MAARVPAPHAYLAGAGEPLPSATAMPNDAPPPSLPTLRVDDSAREHTIAQLSDAFARGMLPMDELERRMERVYQAGVRSELQALVSDLAPGADASAIQAPAAEQRIRARFSNVKRMRIAVLPKRLRIDTFAGNVVLDLRHSTFEPGAMEIDIRATLGNVELYLPAHVMVESQGSGLFGSFIVSDETAGRGALEVVTTRQSTVRIVGRAILSNVEIHHVPT
jgi:Domain of unknown function (DUF1707)/Cell wall-active antibiotics response 4TMS YvqF